jgi:hypothetical protein
MPDLNGNDSKNPECDENVSATMTLANVQKSTEERKDDKSSSDLPPGSEEERNSRSVFVKNVHYAAST